MIGPEPVRSLLDKITAREQAIAAETEQVRVRLDELTALLRELEQEVEHLRITRKTVLALGDEPDRQPQPAVPEHPAYQQILAAFAEARKPLRARDLCQALDLDIAPKNIESTRHKLKRLVSRGILAEPEPGLFTLLRA